MKYDLGFWDMMGLFIAAYWAWQGLLAAIRSLRRAWRDPDDCMARLEALASAVRAGMSGDQDHPWIPGAYARPVRDALNQLDQR